MSVVPRYATPRNLDRPTLGGEVGEILRRLGTPPMPWQQLVLDVAYELDPESIERDSAGHIVRCRLVYREVRLTIQRQAGKTTLALARHVHRHLRNTALGWGKRPVTLYTAQSASAARDKLVEEWAPAIEDSPYIDNMRQLLRSNGREAILWKLPGGRILTVPPTRTGGHGITSVDLVDTDEAFAHRTGDVEQGTRPTMITRPSPQLWVTSTAGTVESEYFWGKVDDGRARCESGVHGSVCYVEYSAYPGETNSPLSDFDGELDDLLDLHPAVGYTISREALKADIDAMQRDEALRAYGNIWTQSIQRIIPAASWSACCDYTSTPQGRLFLAVDCAPGKASGRTATIAIGGRNMLGRTHVEIIDHAPGLSWVADRVGELTRQWTAIEEVFIDPAGAIAAVVPDIERASAANLHLTDAKEMAAACQRFHEDVISEPPAVAHIGQDVLDAAVEGAAKRTLLDSWAWARRTSTSEISPLVAATLAHWAVVTHPDGPLRIY